MATLFPRRARRDSATLSSRLGAQALADGGLAVLPDQRRDVQIARLVERPAARRGGPGMEGNEAAPPIVEDRLMAWAAEATHRPREAVKDRLRRGCAWTGRRG